MKQVKNISKQDLSLESIGIVKQGETVEVKDSFNNANFEEVSTKEKEKVGEFKNNNKKGVLNEDIK